MTQPIASQAHEPRPWLTLEPPPREIQALTGDVSPRRYFRAVLADSRHVTSRRASHRFGTAGTGTVIGNDIATFTKESISGGAVTAYNAAGTPVNLQLRWAKTDSATLGTGHQDVWNLFYQTSTSATGTQVAWAKAVTPPATCLFGVVASGTRSSNEVPMPL